MECASDFSTVAAGIPFDQCVEARKSAIAARFIFLFVRLERVASGHE